MTRTLKLATIAVATMFIALVLPGTAQAQIGCWQEGAFNGPGTCQCVGKQWLWTNGAGYCPWDEAGKTNVVPLYEQQAPPPPPTEVLQPAAPQPTEQPTHQFNRRQEPVVIAPVYRQANNDKLEAVAGGAGCFGIMIFLVFMGIVIIRYFHKH